MVAEYLPQVSIIIPAFNVNDYIAPCIISCINQDYGELEIIVINDGSTDCTEQRIKELIISNPNIRLINKENGGVTAARQTGLELATGEYVFFLDGDDRLHLPNSISRLVECAQKLNADYVAGDFIIVYGDGTNKPQKFPSYETHDSKSALAYAFLNNDFYYTGRLIRRTLVNEVNRIIPRDITYGEDTYAVVRLLSELKCASKINEPILEYVQRSDSVTNRLSRKDLEKRNKAISLTLNLSDQLGFEKFAQKEILVYALRELYQSITLGVPNYDVARKYLKGIRNAKDDIEKYLGRKAYMILLFASINLPATCKAIQLLKKLR